MKNILFSTCLLALISFQVVGQNKVKPVLKKKQVDTVKVIRKKTSVAKKKDTTSKAVGKKPVDRKEKPAVIKKKAQGKKENTKASSTWLGIDLKIWLFIAGVAVQFAVQHLYNTLYKNSVDRKKKHKYLIATVTSHISLLERQIEVISPFVEMLEKKEMADGTLFRITGLTKDNMDAVPRTEAFNIFVLKGGNTKEKSEAFAKLYNTIDLVDDTHSNMESALDKYLSLDTEYYEEWKTCLQSVNNFIQKLIPDANKGTIKDQFLIDILTEYDLFVKSQTKHSDIYVLEENLIRPLWELCDTPTGQASSQRSEILNYIHLCNLAFQNYEKNRVNNLSIFEGIKATFEDSKTNIETSIKTLQK